MVRQPFLLPSRRWTLQVKRSTFTMPCSQWKTWGLPKDQLSLVKPKITIKSHRKTFKRTQGSSFMSGDVVFNQTKSPNSWWLDQKLQFFSCFFLGTPDFWSRENHLKSPRVGHDWWLMMVNDGKFLTSNYYWFVVQCAHLEKWWSESQWEGWHPKYYGK